MKKLFLAVCVVVSAMAYSQNIEPKLEAVGSSVKATYYFENGKIMQEGFFKDGKLDGKWVAYNEDGSIKQVAYYQEGLKTGTWITYSNNMVTQELAYSNNELLSKK